MKGGRKLHILLYLTCICQFIFRQDKGAESNASEDGVQLVQDGESNALIAIFFCPFKH